MKRSFFTDIRQLTLKVVSYDMKRSNPQRSVEQNPSFAATLALSSRYSFIAKETDFCSFTHLGKIVQSKPFLVPQLFKIWPLDGNVVLFLVKSVTLVLAALPKIRSKSKQTFSGNYVSM